MTPLLPDRRHILSPSPLIIDSDYRATRRFAPPMLITFADAAAYQRRSLTLAR